MSQAVPKFSSCVRGQKNVGRAGMPEELVLRMYEDYLRLRSLRDVGRLHGRTRQAMHELFRVRKLKLYPQRKLLHEPVHYLGRKYTPGKGGYLRDTAIRHSKVRRELMLQRVVWIQHHGPIPPRHEIIFLDGNKRNCAIENLRCLPRSEARGARASGRNGFTASAPARLDTLVRNFTTGRPTVATRMKG